MPNPIHLSSAASVLVLVLASCAQAGPAEPSTPDATVPSAPQFEALYEAILRPRCVSCHKPDGLCPYLDMSSSAVAYRALLTGDAAAEGLCRGAGARVTPGDCAGSLLYRKLLDGPSPCGSRMPLRDVPLTDAALAQVCAWIEAGARE